LFLHNNSDIDRDYFISPADVLIAASPNTYNYVLANPPFGKLSNQTITNDEGEQERDNLTYNRLDFWASTSNKQLNFVQHIRSMLKITGLAADIVPDHSVTFIIVQWINVELLSIW
jgi:type I restriction enzyme M protein